MILKSFNHSITNHLIDPNFHNFLSKYNYFKIYNFYCFQNHLNHLVIILKEFHFLNKFLLKKVFYDILYIKNILF
jgi:hypothetical protein